MAVGGEIGTHEPRRASCFSALPTSLFPREGSMANQSVFGTAKRLTINLPLRERAAWLFLSALADVVGAVSYRGQRLLARPDAESHGATKR